MRKQVLFFCGLLLALGAFWAVPVPTQAAAVKGGTVTVESVPGETLTQIVSNRVEHSWPWYIVRASGIVAGISLVALLLSGIGSVTGHFFKILEPITAWATHRALGITFVASVIVHIVTLMFDKFAPFSLAQLLIPWVSNLKPVTLFGINFGSIFVALGIFALYGSIAVLVTSLIWIDRKPRLWKLTHYLSYGVIVAVFIHALYLGTDTGHGLGRIAWVGANIVILFFIILRLRRVGTT